MEKQTRDSDLVRDITLKRCEASFRALFTEYAPKLLHFMSKGGLASEEAKELVQETMTKVWLKSDLYSEDKGAVSTWIFTVARNTKYDYLRKTQKSGVSLSIEDVWHDESVASVMSNEETNKIEAKAELGLIKKFLAYLPIQQKEIFDLVYFEEMTHQECAAELSLPLGTVKSRIRLACRKLNQLLGEDQ